MKSELSSENFAGFLREINQWDEVRGLKKMFVFGNICVMRVTNDSSDTLDFIKNNYFEGVIGRVSWQVL